MASSAIALKARTVVAAGALAAAMGVFSAGSAEAVQPNYTRYCQTTVPGSFVNRLRTTGAYICTQRSRFQLRHHRINLARACQLTTGNTRYRNFGRGFVQCGNRVVKRRFTPRTKFNRPVTSRRASWVQRTPNLRAYCRRQHPGSFVNRFRRTGEYICTQRSRFQMRHYRINMAQACYLSWRTTRVQYLYGNRSNPRCLVRV
ncbi:MAG: hypothetical protein ACTSUD_02955 [Alphaproteobacteria bacterium]